MKGLFWLPYLIKCQGVCKKNDINAKSRQDKLDKV